MITLSRLNGQVVAINPDLIAWIEVTPDTTVSLVGGEKIIVREVLDDVIARVIEFRRAIGGGTPGYEGVIERLARRSSDRPRSPSLQASTGPSGAHGATRSPSSLPPRSQPLHPGRK